jgi:hypothetical protein
VATADPTPTEAAEEAPEQVEMIEVLRIGLAGDLPDGTMNRLHVVVLSEFPVPFAAAVSALQFAGSPEAITSLVREELAALGADPEDVPAPSDPAEEVGA